jgi:hypothetical protein
MNGGDAELGQRVDELQVSTLRVAHYYRHRSSGITLRLRHSYHRATSRRVVLGPD